MKYKKKLFFLRVDEVLHRSFFLSRDTEFLTDAFVARCLTRKLKKNLLVKGLGLCFFKEIMSASTV